MSKILITGGSGLVGTRLTQLLLKKGHQVAHLSRSAKLQKGAEEVSVYHWDLKKRTLDENALKNTDIVVHLAGAGVADKRWTNKRKKEIVNSRIDSSKLLYRYLSRTEHQVKTFIGATAVGYYGHRGEDLLMETEAPSTDFLANTCRLWEKYSLQIAGLDIRTTLLRIGIVLSLEGGALPQTAMPIKFRLGTYFGDGKQYYSWIHIDDLCGIIMAAIEKDAYEGIYNAVAPHPVQMKTLVQEIGKAMGHKTLMVPVPAFALRMAMGEMSSFLLDSIRVSSAKVEAAGYEFQYPELPQALKEIY